MKGPPAEADLAPPVDADALGAALRREVRGDVRFDAQARALYATDASNYRQVPIGVVLPKDAADVEAVVAICRAHGAPILARGGGTSLAGQTCNVAVVLDFTRHMNHILEIDPATHVARVEPGVVLDQLRAETEKHHLTFAPDPATHPNCTLGGMIGNDSCGVHSVMGGRTSHNVHSLDVLTYRGARMRIGAYDERAYGRALAAGGPLAEALLALRKLSDRHADRIRQRFPDIPRVVSGYNLPALLPENGFHVARALVGTEGTCVTVLEATLRLVPSPPARVLLVLGYPDIFTAADRVEEVLAAGPIALEGLDEKLVQDIRKKLMPLRGLTALPEGGAWLLTEFGGAEHGEAVRNARGLIERLKGRPDAPTFHLCEDAVEAARVWKVRESGLAATARVPGQRDTWPGWEDAAVPPAQLGAYLRDFRKLLDAYGYDAALYGHFGQGCVHCRIDFGLSTPRGISVWKGFLREAADLVVSMGGSLSGEHGDGQARGWLLGRMFGEELVGAFRTFKRAWDPDGRMNPGKVVDAAPVDAHLRVGPGFSLHDPKSLLKWPDDEGSFGRAAMRCVGVGLCRREHGGTMCPSWRATHEEQHTTRGRARLLQEMLRSDSPLDTTRSGGFASEAVHEALDLCLACKGCRSDCPMGVDMAAYKAEFLAHHWRGHLRPRAAYAFGFIDRWARLAAVAPGLVNGLTGSSFGGWLARATAGVAKQRPLPRFAPRSFKELVRARAPVRKGTRVLLWADTFTNHLHPEVGMAAIEVLEAAGFDAIVPQQALCCGRPLYDYGWLRQARGYLERVLAAMRPWLAEGLPVVVLEPSCLATFRDELLQTFPDRDDAKALAKAATSLGELLRERAPGFRPGVPDRVALHGHCHQKAIWGTGADEALLAHAGARVDVLASGCCGMAGAFGFEADKFDVSRRVFAADLGPALYRYGDGVVITDGFSCRTQLSHLAGRRGWHLAELLQAGLQGEAPPTAPERREAAEIAVRPKVPEPA
jgi:FAD/FMN-containing dehydrogenase/Fe-S oxidoreductase